MPPFGAGRGEHLVQALLDGLEGDPDGARDDQHPHAVGDPAAAQQVGGGAQVLDPAVGAGADEDRVDRDLAQRGAGLQSHVGEGVLGGDPLLRVGEGGRVRHRGAERGALAGVGAPGDEGGQLGGVDEDLVVEDRVLVGAQGPPVLDGGVPVLALRGVRAALEVGEGGLVRGDHAGPGTRLDGHVADGHPGLHGEAADRRTPVLQDVALAAAGADPGDDRQDEVLGGDALGQFALDGDRHGPERGQRQRLGGEHVLDLAGADAERQRAESAVGGGVGIAADHGRAGLGEAQLGADDVHDALLDVAEGVDPDAELRRVLAQGLQLDPGDRVCDRLVDVQGRGVVVLGGDREIGASDRAPGQPEAVEGLRAGHLVEQVQVDVEQVGLALRAPHDVVVPDLLCECPSHRNPSSRPRCRPSRVVGVKAVAARWCGTRRATCTPDRCPRCGHLGGVASWMSPGLLHPEWRFSQKIELASRGMRLQS